MIVLWKRKIFAGWYRMDIDIEYAVATGKVNDPVSSWAREGRPRNIFVAIGMTAGLKPFVRAA